jgi:hypothetical protein
MSTSAQRARGMSFSATISARTKFIDGLPMKLATKRFTGSR